MKNLKSKMVLVPHYAFFLVIFSYDCVCFSQSKPSKKDQIERLTYRVDSLNQVVGDRQMTISTKQSIIRDKELTISKLSAEIYDLNKDLDKINSKVQSLTTQLGDRDKEINNLKVQSKMKADSLILLNNEIVRLNTEVKTKEAPTKPATTIKTTTSTTATQPSNTTSSSVNSTPIKVSCTEFQDYPKKYIGKKITLAGVNLNYYADSRHSGRAFEETNWVVMGFSLPDFNDGDYFSRYASCNGITDKHIKLVFPFSLNDEIPNMPKNTYDRTVIITGVLQESNVIRVSSIKRYNNY